MILLVAGASLSGKTEVVSEVAKQNGYETVSLDIFYLKLKYMGLSDNALVTITQKHTTAELERRLSLGGTCIVEGGWCNPDMAAKIRERYSATFTAVYCGYPNADPVSRYELVKGGKHWVARKTSEYALNWIARQIKGSEWYESEAKRYGFEFIDFSDFDSGTMQLRRAIREAMATA